MLRPKKFRNDNALECPHCFKMCKLESGLTRHCNSLHSHYSEGSFQSPDPSGSPDLVGIPLDIMDAPSLLSGNEEDLSSQLSEFLSEIPRELSDDFQYDSEDDADSDSSSEAIELVEEFTSHSDIIQQHEALSHHNAGYIYETQGTESQVFEIQNNLQEEHGYPFSPWANEDEFWLAYVIFVKAKISMSACNDLLDGFKAGRISMHDSLSFYTNQKMLKIIDQAKFVTVFGILNLPR